MASVNYIFNHFGWENRMVCLIVNEGWFLKVGSQGMLINTISSRQLSLIYIIAPITSSGGIKFIHQVWLKCIEKCLKTNHSHHWISITVESVTFDEIDFTVVNFPQHQFQISLKPPSSVIQHSNDRAHDNDDNCYYGDPHVRCFSWEKGR